MSFAETVTILSSDDEDEGRHQNQQQLQQPAGSSTTPQQHLTRRQRMEDPVICLPDLDVSINFRVLKTYLVCVTILEELICTTMGGLPYPLMRLRHFGMLNVKFILLLFAFRFSLPKIVNHLLQSKYMLSCTFSCLQSGKLLPRAVAVRKTLDSSQCHTVRLDPVLLKSHALRVGSMQGSPYEPIAMTVAGIHINLECKYLYLIETTIIVAKIIQDQSYRWVCCFIFANAVLISQQKVWQTGPETSQVRLLIDP